MQGCCFFLCCFLKIVLVSCLGLLKGLPVFFWKLLECLSYGREDVSRERVIVFFLWLWVKKGYHKNPIGKRKHRLKPVVPKGFLFDPNYQHIISKSITDIC